ncbi:MAG: hypothetical protein O3C18_03780 [Bacteroidetes bacterium]|nr:hypothetical protein [Bacteroidota bacterium]
MNFLPSFKPVLGLSLVGFLSLPSLLAQRDTLEMDVTFVGNRTMEVRDAVKLNSWPSARPLSVEKPVLNYELLVKRLNVEPVMTPVEATRLRVDDALPRLYRGYARAGLGSRGTTYLDASFTDLRSRDGSWGTSLHHMATSSPSRLRTGRVQDHGAQLWGSRFLGSEKVDAQIGWTHERVLMYGLDSVFSDTAFTASKAPSVSWQSLQGQVHFKSHDKDSTALNHNLNLMVGMLSNTMDARESTFRAGLGLQKSLGQDMLRADVHVQLDNYSLDTLTQTTQAIVRFTPSIHTRRGPLSASAGLRLAIDADAPSRTDVGQSFFIYPQAEVSLNLLRNLFVPYAQLGGDLQANSFHSLRAVNPFYAPQSLANTSYRWDDQTDLLDTLHLDGYRSTNKRLALAAGVRGTITDVFTFHAFANTAQYEDMMLFQPMVVDSLTDFVAVYDTVGVQTLGGEASLTIGDRWNVSGGCSLHSYSLRFEDRAWHLPKVTWQASATYAWIEGLTLTADASFVGERYALTNREDYGETTFIGDGHYEMRLPAYLDLNVRADYRYNDRMGAWLTLANLTNAKYAVWGGSPVQGFQALAGVHYAF